MQIKGKNFQRMQNFDLATYQEKYTLLTHCLPGVRQSFLLGMHRVCHNILRYTLYIALVDYFVIIVFMETTTYCIIVTFI